VGTIVKRGKVFRALIRKKGNVVTKTFADTSLAQNWIDATERTIDKHESASRITAPEDQSKRMRQLESDNVALTAKCEALHTVVQQLIEALRATEAPSTRLQNGLSPVATDPTWISVKEAASHFGMTFETIKIC
jgi:hypothetical protein